MDLKSVFSSFFMIIFINVYGQINLKDLTMCKDLTKLEYENILNDSKKTSLSFISRDKITKERYTYTSFSDKELLIKKNNNNERHIELYENEESFFEYNNHSINKKLNHPLFKYRYIMSDIESYKNRLIEELFKKLDIKYPKSISEVNFDEINNKLIEFGIKEIYENFYLHLVLFFGEYLNEVDKNQGKWVLKHNSNYPLSFQPSFVDSQGKDYYFILNVNLAREMQARFLGEDYASDNDIDLNIPFNLKSILFESFDYRDLTKE